MKKLISIISIVLISCFLFSCKSDEDENKENNNTSNDTKEYHDVDADGIGALNNATDEEILSMNLDYKIRTSSGSSSGIEGSYWYKADTKYPTTRRWSFQYNNGNYYSSYQYHNTSLDAWYPVKPYQSDSGKYYIYKDSDGKFKLCRYDEAGTYHYYYNLYVSPNYLGFN